MFQTLARLLGAKPAPAPAAPAAPKTRLGVSALETRECPAVLAAHLSSDPNHVAAHAPPATHAAPALMAMARPVHGLNPQPLPP